MAEAKDNSDTGEEFLKCPICLEFYVDPKFLPCLHTFCRSCLQTYITSSTKEEISGKKTKVDFACPICRTTVTSPYSGEIKIEDLASQFPTHQTISSLLDKHNLEANAKYCDPCLAEKSENLAKTWCKVCCEAFCDECTKWHRKMSILKSHKLVQLSDMNTNELDITRLEFCDVHKGEVLKAFCKDHDTACCVTCVTIKHRKCHDVTTLEEAARGIKETIESQKFLTQLQDSEKALSEMLRIRKLNVSGLETQKETLLAELSAFRKRIYEHYNDLEVKLKEEISSKQKELLLQEHGYLSDLENKYLTVLNYRKLFEACLQKASDVHILLELKTMVKKTENFFKEFSAYKANAKEITLEIRYEPIIQNMLSVLNLGRVRVPNKPQLRCISSFQLLREILSGTFLKNGKVILTTPNRFVACDEQGNNMLITDVSGASRLNGVTEFQNNSILLARTSKNIVYLVNVNSNRLQNWKTNFTCENIVCAESCIIVASYTHLKVLDFYGLVTQSVRLLGDNVRYIAYHSGMVYYTISDEHAVRAVSLNGIHGFEYKNPDLRDPRGIDTDTKGNIFVAGYISSNVHIISQDGELLNIILTNIVNPNVVCISKSGDRLLVSHLQSKVNVYELC